MKHLPKVSYLLLVISVWGQSCCFAQDYQRQQKEIFALNIISNGVSAGLSGAFNKQKQEKWFPVFVKNFGKGCLGGAIKYTAKYSSFYLNDVSNNYLALPNRAFFFLGHSITMNASLNQKMFENFYLNLYGFNFYFGPNAGGENKFRVKFSLGTVASVIYFHAQGNKLDYRKSFTYGQFYFDLTPNAKLSVGGRSFFNVFAIRKYTNGSVYQAAIPHEIVHTYQMYDFFSFSSFYKVKLESSLNKRKLYKTISKYVTFEYQFGFFLSAYLLQPKPTYYRNVFEYEAAHFAEREYIMR